MKDINNDPFSEYIKNLPPGINEYPTSKLQVSAPDADVLRLRKH